MRHDHRALTPQSLVFATVESSKTAIGPCQSVKTYEWRSATVRSPLRIASMAGTRSSDVGPASRPVAVPEDLDEVSFPTATGVVELPIHIRWSEPTLRYDLKLREDRVRVYEQVLREGTEEDIRHYIDPHELRVLFEDLVLPPNVRKAWAGWLSRHISPDSAC